MLKSSISESYNLTTVVAHEHKGPAHSPPISPTSVTVHTVSEFNKGTTVKACKTHAYQLFSK